MDDVAEQRDIVPEMLTKLGYGVASVSSGEETVEYLNCPASAFPVASLLERSGDPVRTGLQGA